MTKRLLLIMLLSSGCSNLSNYNLYIDSIRASTIGFSNPTVTTEFYDNFEYSFLKLRVGKLKPVYLVLAKVNQDILHWVSNDGISIFTYKGKIIKTQGLEHDISLINYQKHLACYNCAYMYLSDFLEPSLVSAKTNASLEISNNKIFTYLGNHISVTEYLEIVKIDSINWEQKNMYYLDPISNRVLQSKQKFHPFQKEYELTFYYK